MGNNITWKNFTITFSLVMIILITTVILIGINVSFTDSFFVKLTDSKQTTIIKNGQSKPQYIKFLSLTEFSDDNVYILTVNHHRTISNFLSTNDKKNVMDWLNSNNITVYDINN